MNKASVLSALPFFFQLLSVSQATVFQPSSLKAFFVEQFTSSSFGTWSPSEAVKEGYGAERETMQYNGKWSVEEASTYPGLEGDLGLVVKTTAAHHAISIPFKTLLEPEKEFASGKKEGLVVQYEVKLQNGLDCGGAYIKLLSDDEKGIQAQEFSDKTPYTIMFGPDKCGGTQKVHLIIRHENPLTGEYEEKHLKNPPNPRTDKLTHLYTLIIKPDQTYEIKIDNESAKSGSLLEDFEPPFNPPKEINDPEDKKPADWIDAARIPDPEATKPDDWDEDAPREIPDLDAVKPDSWLEEEPTTIPDPESEKPEEWDDEEDGDWIAPSIPNPKCEDVAGCGPWNRPVKPNPDYKGIWTAPYIDNPDYIGIWTPRKIPNPNYYEDLTPADLNPMAGIGIELWTMSNDILFDNFLVSFNPEDAETFAKETYLLKVPLEEAKEEADKPKVEESETVGEDKTFAEDPVGFAKTKLRTFIDVAVVDPVYAFKSMPETGSVLVASVIGLIGVLGVLMNVLNPAPAKKVVEPAKKVVKKEAEPAKKDGSEAAPTPEAEPATEANETASSTKKKSGKGGKSKADNI